MPSSSKEKRDAFEKSNPNQFKKARFLAYAAVAIVMIILVLVVLDPGENKEAQTDVGTEKVEAKPAGLTENAVKEAIPRSVKVSDVTVNKDTGAVSVRAVAGQGTSDKSIYRIAETALFQTYKALSTFDSVKIANVTVSSDDSSLVYYKARLDGEKLRAIDFKGGAPYSAIEAAADKFTTTE